MSPCYWHAFYMLSTNFMSRPFLTMVSFVHRTGMYISAGFSTPSLHARVRIPRHSNNVSAFCFPRDLDRLYSVGGTWRNANVRHWMNCNYIRYCALVYMHERCHLLMLHVAQRIIEQVYDVFFSVLHFDWKTLLSGNMALCCPVSLAASSRSIEKRQKTQEPGRVKYTSVAGTEAPGCLWHQTGYFLVFTFGFLECGIVPAVQWREQVDLSLVGYYLYNICCLVYLI